VVQLPNQKHPIYVLERFGSTFGILEKEFGVRRPEALERSLRSLSSSSPISTGHSQTPSRHTRSFGPLRVGQRAPFGQVIPMQAA
jgi:hypothetical protein